MNTVVYSLPIYSCSKEKLEKDYQIFLRKKAQTGVEIAKEFGKQESEVLDRFHQMFWKKNIWKYNQVIGYLEVVLAFDGNCIAFESYLPEEKRNMRFSDKKKWLSLQHIGGYYVDLEGTNEQIGKSVLKTIKTISRDNKWMIDLDSFKLVFKDIDYLWIAKQLRVKQ